MIDKVVASPAEAVSVVGEGAVVMIGGFGEVGSPIELIHALIDRGVGRLTVINKTGRAIQASARVSLSGHDPHDEQLGSLAPGKTTSEIHVPDIDVATELCVHVRTTAGQSLGVYKTVWQPQRHWVVYIIKSTHHDLGYEDHEHTPRCHVYGFHDLRRAFATVNAETLTADSLRKLMRHRSYSTTQRYINMASQLNRAIEGLHVPKVLRKRDTG